jgi:hypothetical protein
MIIDFKLRIKLLIEWSSELTMVKTVCNFTNLYYNMHIMNEVECSMTGREGIIVYKRTSHSSNIKVMSSMQSIGY